MSGTARANRMQVLIASVSRLWANPGDQPRIAAALKALDDKYDLSLKMTREPGVQDILQQMAGRMAEAFSQLADILGKRVLDIACGSNTSRAPASLYINTPFGENRIENPNLDKYTAQFEPWFCRMLLEVGATPPSALILAIWRGKLLNIIASTSGKSERSISCPITLSMRCKIAGSLAPPNSPSNSPFAPTGSAWPKRSESRSIGC